MSNVEEIGHLVVPFEVDNNWVCTLCEEGKVFVDSIVRHSCGNHLFHCSCLSLRLIMNPTCPTCQTLGTGTIAQMNNIKIGVTNNRSDFNEICMKCMEIIYRREEHVKIHRCKHRIHKNCVIDLILEKGITSNGSVFCPLCRTP
jgi:hypothetical protein